MSRYYLGDLSDGQSRAYLQRVVDSKDATTEKVALKKELLRKEKTEEQKRERNMGASAVNLPKHIVSDQTLWRTSITILMIDSIVHSLCLSPSQEHSAHDSLRSLPSSLAVLASFSAMDS